MDKSLWILSWLDSDDSGNCSHFLFSFDISVLSEEDTSFLLLLLLFSDCFLFFPLHGSGSLKMIYDNSHVNAHKLVDLPAADAIFPLVL